jgi:hypothetical protein
LRIRWEIVANSPSVCLASDVLVESRPNWKWLITRPARTRNASSRNVRRAAAWRNRYLAAATVAVVVMTLVDVAEIAMFATAVSLYGI